MNNALLIPKLILSLLALSVTQADEIRPYRDGDYTHAILAESKGNLGGQQESVEQFITQIEASFKDPNFVTMVCIREDKPVGFINYSKNGYNGHIILLAVGKEQQGQGIGKALLATALQDLKKIGTRKVTLYTQVGNVRARALYEKHGFVLAAPIHPLTRYCSYELSLED